MSVSEHEDGLEQHIAQWRAYLRRRRAIRAVDIEELEDHLRAQFVSLVDAGLTADEAFLVAVKRMGDLDELSREFAREYSERLWKQLVVPSGNGGEPGGAERTEAAVVVALAVVSALAVKVPELFGVALGDETAGFYARNMSLFVLPPLTGYFLWKRHLDRITLGWLALVFVAAALFANAFPFSRGGATEVLTAVAPAHRSVAGRRHRLRRRSLEYRRRSHGLRAVLGRAGHLLCADCLWRRCPHRLHAGDVRIDRTERRVVGGDMGGAMRGPRSRHHRVVAGGGRWRQSKA